MKKLSLYLAMAALAACTNANQQDQQSADSSSVQSKQDSTAARASEGKMDSLDLSFFKRATVGGLVEIEASNQILSKTKVSAVKNLATMMVTDHTKLNQQVASLAKQKGYEPPTALPTQQEELIRKMDEFKEEGRNEYYVRLMAEEHVRAIDLFTLAGGSTDAEVRNLALQTLPKLKQHYTHIMKLDTLLRLPRANQGDDPLKLSDRYKKTPSKGN